MILKKRNIFIITLCLINLSEAFSQELDVDELLQRLDRIEKNISDLQKGRFEEVEKSLSTGYISRNESRLGDFETKLRTNFGLFEESNNKIKNVEEKLNLIDKDFQSRITKIEKRIEVLKKREASNKKSFIEQIQESPVSKSVKRSIKNEKKSEITNNGTNLSEEEIKKKYENAIKLLWANKYEKAEDELLQLKQINPDDLMPNIQYWLGEVYYANKNFQQAVIEFGEGFANFPDSIKGPDNLLKLGLSFSNMNQKNEACSAFYELEVKYKSSPKNVLERSQEERKKLNCPEE
tara:strand:- start:188 stop:1066 length:879 start_codon:yes stop_codon:yes gene_type:complete